MYDTHLCSLYICVFVQLQCAARPGDPDLYACMYLCMHVCMHVYSLQRGTAAAAPRPHTGIYLVFDEFLIYHISTPEKCVVASCRKLPHHDHHPIEYVVYY